MGKKMIGRFSLCATHAAPIYELDFHGWNAIPPQQPHKEGDLSRDKLIPNEQGREEHRLWMGQN